MSRMSKNALAFIKGESLKVRAKKFANQVIECTFTRITMSVNGHNVDFTFVGNPSVEYMEKARKQAELIENGTS